MMRQKFCLNLYTCSAITHSDNPFCLNTVKKIPELLQIFSDKFDVLW